MCAWYCTPQGTSPEVGAGSTASSRDHCPGEQLRSLGHVRAATGTHTEPPGRVVVNGFTTSAIPARGGCHSHFGSARMKVGQA